jgi:hypothetical protein
MSMFKKSQSQETKRAGRQRLDTLHSSPKLHDVRMLLVEAQRNKGTLCELPLQTPHGIFVLSCQSDHLSPEPCWTLYEGNDGSKQIWSYMNEDLQMITDIVNMSISEKAPTADVSTAFAEVNNVLSSELSAKAEENKPWGQYANTSTNPGGGSWPQSQPQPEPQGFPQMDPSGGQQWPNAQPSPQQWPGGAPQQQWPNAQPSPQQWPGAAPQQQWPEQNPAAMPPQQQQWPGTTPSPQQWPGAQPSPQQWPGAAQQQQWPEQNPAAMPPQPQWPGGMAPPTPPLPEPAPAPSAPPPAQSANPWLKQPPADNKGQMAKFIAFLAANKNVTVGEVLFAPDLPQTCADSAMRLQEMICKSEISDKQGIEALKLAAERGTGVVDESVLGEIRMRSNVSNEAARAAAQLLKDAGLISEADMNAAETKALDDGKPIGEILIETGKSDKLMVEQATKCVGFINDGKIMAHQAIMALLYCSRARAPIEQAFDELSIDVK